MERERSTRRSLLAGAGTAVVGALAGCISLSGGQSDSSDDPQTTTYPGDALRLTFGTEFSQNGIRARPIATAVQRSVHVRRDASADVHAGEGRQLLFLDVQTGNSPGIDPPLPADFAVDVGGELHRGWTTHPDVDGLPVPDEFPVPYGKEGATGRQETDIYGGEGHRGWVGFDLPASPGEDPNLLLQPTEAGRPFAVWPLPDPTVDRLGAPFPAFSVEDTTVPGSAEGGEAQVSVTAANDGDGEGTFRVAVVAGDGDATALGGTAIAPGEAGTWEGSVAVPEDGDAVTVAVRTAAEEVTREVRIG